ncbi:MAG: penicillin-binding protein activator [Hyphomicrobiales bacterium]
MTYKLRTFVARYCLPLFMLAFAAVLSGCIATGPQNGGGLGALQPALPDTTPQPTLPVTASLPAANGRTLGTGPIRVAMLVPITASGFGALAAENFVNAADLALREFDSTAVQIVVKNTSGTATGAANAAREAIREGAEVILGPMFSKAVPAVASVARPAGVPVITFSSSTSVASNGVYVFGFAPEPGIIRAVRHSGSTGSRSYAALLPNNALGNLSEGAFRQAVASAGGRIASITRYNYGNNEPNIKAQEVGALAQSGQVDTIFIPDAGDVVPQLIASVKQAAPTAQNIKFIGSGQWDDPRIFRNSALSGAAYPAPDRDGFNKFAQRYNGAFGKPPIRLASLGYDLASLMVVLTKRFPQDRFATTRLTDPNGFNGVVDGTFRLSTNGRVQRSLAVYEVTPSGPRVVSPAPRTFSQTAFN